ncbi:polysaccharide biosynthesis/export family protein [Paraglaciecola sp. 2405UD69-4]|uniref:polysaccharide biosynthesis/export family protein n=1 Tax=Paraglaciecola sp. 2405UD69-4 TaxID=3391836 RepID=UPI0039C9B91A
MKLIIKCLLGAMCCISFLVISQDAQNYRLSTDDQISIRVFNEPELTIQNVKISTNGTIAMPLLGQVDIHNLTVSQAELKLSKLLLDGYLKKPNVTITITEYRPFYIGGEVNRPGSYPYRKDLTIQKAITIAGGFTSRASESSISIVNEEESRELLQVPFTTKIMPGDVITVNESFF